MTYKILDVHVHLPNSRFIGTLGTLRISLEKYFKAKLLEKSYEDVIEELRGAGVWKAVALPLDASPVTGVRGNTNEEMAELQDKYGEFFICFATVDPHSQKIADELEDSVKRLGLKGLKLHPQLQRFYPNDPRMKEVYETAEELDIPIVFHTGTSGIGVGIEGGGGIKLDYGRPIYIDHVAAEYPKLRIIMAHMGWPWHEEALAIAIQKANVYLDVSGWRPKYIPEVIKRYMDTLLKDKFMFGSDYPALPPAEVIEDFKNIGLREETLEKVFHINAVKFLRIK